MSRLPRTITELIYLSLSLGIILFKELIFHRSLTKRFTTPTFTESLNCENGFRVKRHGDSWVAHNSSCLYTKYQMPRCNTFQEIHFTQKSYKKVYAAVTGKLYLCLAFSDFRRRRDKNIKIHSISKKSNRINKVNIYTIKTNYLY